MTACSCGLKKKKKKSQYGTALSPFPFKNKVSVWTSTQNCILHLYTFFLAGKDLLKSISNFQSNCYCGSLRGKFLKISTSISLQNIN